MGGFDLTGAITSVVSDVGSVVVRVVGKAGALGLDAARASVDPAYAFDEIKNDVLPFLGEAVSDLAKAGKEALAIVKSAAPYIQLGLSCFPGIGQAASAALGCAVALADGRKITDALMAGAKGAIPGGPIVADAFETAVNAVGNMVEGETIDQAIAHAALDEVRSEIVAHTGQAGAIAFDTGLALAHGRRLQSAGLDAATAAAKGYLPDTPASKAAMVVTGDALRGNVTPATLTGAAREMIPLAPEGADLSDLASDADEVVAKAKAYADAGAAFVQSAYDVFGRTTSRGAESTISTATRIAANEFNPLSVTAIVNPTTTATRIATFRENPLSVAATVASLPPVAPVAASAPAPSRFPSWLGPVAAVAVGIGAAALLKG
jgi:hypothetical protein